MSTPKRCYLFEHGFAVVLEDAGKVKRDFRLTNKNDPTDRSPSMSTGFSINSHFGSCCLVCRSDQKLLYLAALNLKQHSPIHSQHYAREVAEGKPSRLVLNNLSNKLLRIVCAVIRDNRPYQEKHRSMGPQMPFGS